MSVEKMSPLDVYNRFNINLVRKLPMDDAYFLANLTSERLFCGNLRQEVNAKSTSGDKASHFLDKAIRPSLDDPDDTDLNPFFKLLRVMERHDNNLKRLATNIRIELSKHAAYRSRLTIVSREAKKKQAIHDERVSYLHIAPL